MWHQKHKMSGKEKKVEFLYAIEVKLLLAKISIGVSSKLRVR